MQRRLEPTEGYWIFYQVEGDDKGYEKAVEGLLSQIKEAEKNFKVTPISGVSVKEGIDSRAIAIALQTAILERK